MGIMRYKPKEKNIIKLKKYLNDNNKRLGKNLLYKLVGNKQQ